LLRVVIYVVLYTAYTVRPQRPSMVGGYQ